MLVVITLIKTGARKYMAMKPERSNQKTESNIDYAILNEQKFAQLQAGLNVVYLNAVIFAGTQEREPMKQDDGTYKDMNPIQQVLLYVDFPNVTIDWDACAKDSNKEGYKPIGKKALREPLHSVFKGVPRGVTFSAVPPTDGNGDIIKGQEWTFHANNMLTKIAKATQTLNIIDPDSDDNMDVELLVGKPFLINVEIKEGKNGGKFVKLKDPVPLMHGMEVPENPNKAVGIDFDTTDEEALSNLRFGDMKMLAKAPQFVGSPMAEALKDKVKPAVPLGEEDQTPEPEAKTPAPKTAESKKPEGTGGFDDFDDDIPF